MEPFQKKDIANRIEIVRGDITQMQVDAIVNAANKSLLGGGGVDGAIHRAAGPELLEATKKLGGAKTGEAKTTKGYHLNAKYVIHTVGPIYKDGSQQEPELLKNCYQNSIDAAIAKKAKTIAFPSISTGVYGYPLKEAATIAFHAVVEKLSLPSSREIIKVYFVVFDQETETIYQNIYNNFLKEFE